MRVGNRSFLRHRQSYMSSHEQLAGTQQTCSSLPVCAMRRMRKTRACLKQHKMGDVYDAAWHMQLLVCALLQRLSSSTKAGSCIGGKAMLCCLNKLSTFATSTAAGLGGPLMQLVSSCKADWILGTAGQTEYMTIGLHPARQSRLCRYVICPGSSNQFV